jgi:hypothetical protein
MFTVRREGKEGVKKDTKILANLEFLDRNTDPVGRQKLERDDSIINTKFLWNSQMEMLTPLLSVFAWSS